MDARAAGEGDVSIIGWIILGLLVGWLAALALGDGGYGSLADFAAGIMGAVVGGWVAAALFGGDVAGIDPASLLAAVLGAVIAVAIYRALAGARRLAG